MVDRAGGPLLADSRLSIASYLSAKNIVRGRREIRSKREAFVCTMTRGQRVVHPTRLVSAPKPIGPFIAPKPMGSLLGRLAVDQSVKGQGVGRFLLMDAVRRSLEAASTIAAMAIIVVAKDEAAETCYRHFSFQPPHEQPRPLLAANSARASPTLWKVAFDR